MGMKDFDAKTAFAGVALAVGMGASAHAAPKLECSIEPFMKGYAAVVRKDGHVESGSNPLVYRGLEGLGKDTHMTYRAPERYANGGVKENKEVEVHVNTHTGKATCITEAHPKGVAAAGSAGSIEKGTKPIDVLQRIHQSVPVAPKLPAPGLHKK